MTAIAEDREWGVKSIKQRWNGEYGNIEFLDRGMDGDWMNTWEPQEVLTNAQVAITGNSAPKQRHTDHDET